MEIEQSQIGAVGSQSLELTGGKLILKIELQRGAVKSSHDIEVDGKLLADAVIAKLPPEAQPFAKAIEGAILGV
jgi:hypothetical protein